MKLFDDMTFDEKMVHLENCRLDAIECIRNGEPSNLADIADWTDIWGPWLMDECKRLRADNDQMIDFKKWMQEVTRADGIHTCHDTCQRAACVAGRERDALKAEIERLLVELDSSKHCYALLEERREKMQAENEALKNKYIETLGSFKRSILLDEERLKAFIKEHT